MNNISRHLHDIQYMMFFICDVIMMSQPNITVENIPVSDYTKLYKIDEFHTKNTLKYVFYIVYTITFTLMA